MTYKHAEDLVDKLSLRSKTESTRELTRFYVEARFQLDQTAFARQYTDGKNDGGIDFYHTEDAAFFIFQSKYFSKAHRCGEHEIMVEIEKMQNTIAGSNPNGRAADFVHAVRSKTSDVEALLEVVWLTTGVVEASVREKVQKKIDAWRRAKDIKLAIDFITIDRTAIDSVIYDVEHGYVPHTGRRTVRVSEGEWMRVSHEDAGIHGIVCTVSVNDLLRWFESADDVDRFLQKNVRVFRGETKINKGIATSYLSAPALFWYKHNGIIIFVDNLEVGPRSERAILRNPQVVNGGQTLKALFRAYCRDPKGGSSARILLRIYRLPFEDSETYKKSIEIIGALNTQNKIYPSDLRSTDPRQVRIERLLCEMGMKYQRKVEKGRPGKNTIPMRNLALRYHICRKQTPADGVRSEVERLFEEDQRYDEVFPVSAVNRELHDDHVVVDYVTCMRLDEYVQDVRLPVAVEEHAVYVRWYVLADMYRRLNEWKTKKFRGNWRDWCNFTEEPAFRQALSKYARHAYAKGHAIVPTKVDAREFFKSADAYRKFRSRTSAALFDKVFRGAYAHFGR